MGGLKTYVLGLLVAMICGTQALAAPDLSRDPARFFATCLGRFSATMEHEWLMGRDGEQARDQRAMFETLLEVVAPDSALSRADILHMRIEAKFAQAKLLQVASFHTDARQKRYAAGLARREIGSCAALLLG